MLGRMMPKFGDIYEWRPAYPSDKNDSGIVVMYCGPYNNQMDSAFIITMPKPDERLNQLELVWRIGDHEAWHLVDG